MAPKSKKIGRPSAYKEEYCEQATKLCLLGATDKDLAKFFGVKEQTINNWKIDHPSFFESLKAGKEAADAAVVNSLYQKALSGDTTACIFWLKNRQRKHWRDKQDIDVAGNINVKVVNFGSDDSE